MPQYFKINYEFSTSEIWRRIDSQIEERNKDYICVADGNILQMVHNDSEYREVVNGGMFSICDSSWVPVFLKRIHKIDVRQYCGSQIFDDALKTGKYRMAFVGSSQKTLDALKRNLSSSYDSRIAGMLFLELPFRKVEDFDYVGIAKELNTYKPELIWVSLGAPKQEQFMSRLKPFLNQGIMIAIGAAFKFYSGLEEKRAPTWIQKMHIEFIYRIFQDPLKQLRRCSRILLSLPFIILEEKRKCS